MTRRHRTSSTGTGRLASWWPVLLSLLVVLVPTVCVLWFMAEAVENRRLVIRRALADADFALARERLENFWHQQATALERSRDRAETGPALFKECVNSGLADSVVCYDADGSRVYPATDRLAAADREAVDWSDLERLEYVEHDYEAAAAAYAEFFGKRGDPGKEGFAPNLAARAVLAQARCLARSGAIDRAIDALVDTLGQPHFEQATDGAGRLIVPAAELRAAQLIEDLGDPRFLPVVERLSSRLNEYREPAMGSPQRVFLMRELQGLVRARLDAAATGEELATALADAVRFPTLPAEELAARFCEANPLPSKESVVRLSQSPGVWQFSAADGRVVALFRTASLQTRCQEAIAKQGLRTGASVRLVAPGAAASQTAEVHSAEAGSSLPGWRLEHASAIDDFEPLADARTAAYFWTGLLVILAMSIFAALIANAFRRQMRLTRLKNDLVATVSHELKTPLSSIRLLVDTLLDEPRLDEAKAREYLAMVAKENTRLSRMIDNFLAFSRMERNKHAFEFAEVQAANVIEEAMEVARERFQRPSCSLTVDVEPGLPPVLADADALVTVLLNLLDNAFKYSPKGAQIAVRAYAGEGSVCFDVEDDGVGLSKAATRRVFKRFYQVDRRVSRETGGVGLGLSIVQFIVRAHDGRIRVRSRPGAGSTFTVEIPSCATGQAGHEEANR